MRITIFTLVCIMLSVPVAALAGGGTDSPGAPGSAGDMPTFQEIYDYLISGTEETVNQSFEEPAAGPGVTMKSTREIYDAIKAERDTDLTPGNIRKDVDIFGVTGTYEGASGGGGGSSAIPKTGQTVQQAAGDDGALQKGAAWPSPRFTDNSNGTVTDNLTGLIWLKDANCIETVGGVTGGQIPWADALTFCSNLANENCGLSDGSSAGDWRLPNLFELESLRDMSQYGPALPSGHPFSSVQNSYYWSSTSYSHDPADAWGVGLYGGHVSIDDKAGSRCVWPVRGGQ